LYFDSAAEINLRVLELSGGSPTTARALFAIGHMLPSFALLMVGAGADLLLQPHPPGLAYGLVSVGAGIYLLGTRVFMLAERRIRGVARLVVLVATFQLYRLHGTLDGHAYLWFVTVWVVVCAALTSGAVRHWMARHEGVAQPQ